MGKEATRYPFLLSLLPSFIKFFKMLDYCLSYLCTSLLNRQFLLVNSPGENPCCSTLISEISGTVPDAPLRRGSSSVGIFVFPTF